MTAYRIISALPKTVFNEILSEEKEAMTTSIDVLWAELSKQLEILHVRRKNMDIELSPSLSHPAQHITFSLLMEKEDSRREEAISSICMAARSSQEAAAKETSNAQQKIHNALHIMCQLFNTWVMPQYLDKSVAVHAGKDFETIEVAAILHWSCNSAGANNKKSTLILCRT